MPKTTAYQAIIEHISILDENANFDSQLGDGVMTDEQALHLYEHMCTCRELDEVAFKLQRSGRMGTYPQNKGQEAAAVGVALALQKGKDWIVPSYRENAALFMHGLPMHYIFMYWMGDERGSQMPEGVNVTPLSVPIGTHMLHATGIAWAEKLRKSDGVAATFFGDGATSEGDFHEAMNFASTLKVGVVFIGQNNGWAISVPRSKQMNSETLCQKALAYGMPTVRVDGNDIYAVHYAAKDAVARARAGEGPTFIECVTYRLGDHTTADDARRYRDEQEVEAWRNRDPILRVRKYLTAKGSWDDARDEALKAKAKKIVAEVVDAAINVAPPETTDFFDDMYESLPEDLRRQRETMRTSSLGQDPSQVGLNAQAASVEGR